MADRSFWLSWYATKSMGEWELHSPWWISGSRMSDDADCVCAAVRAESETKAKIKIILSYDQPPAQIEWRFCEERPDEWSPFSDRFPRAAWMQGAPPAKPETPGPGKETL